MTTLASVAHWLGTNLLLSWLTICGLCIVGLVLAAKYDSATDETLRFEEVEALARERMANMAKRQARINANVPAPAPTHDEIAVMEFFG